MLSTFVFIAVLSILILVHELGHFAMAKRCGVKVERFSLGFGPKLIAVTKGETEYCLSAIPLGGYVKMAGESPQDSLTGASWEFLSKSPGERFSIVIFGPLLNYLLGFLLFSATFMLGSPTLTNKVGKVLDEYPAKEAGVLAGDEVVSIDGEKVVYWDELTEIMHKKLEGTVRLVIMRDGASKELTLKPRVKEFKDIFGKEIKVAMVGIAPSEELVFQKFGPLEALSRGFSKTIELTVVTFKALGSLVTGRMSMRESVTGPIGIFMITAKAASLGLVYLLNIMAIISTSLAIFNILPIPILDGGHLAFIAIERLRRRPVSPRIQETVSQIGFGLLLLLMFFVFYFDIMRVIGK